MLVPRLKEGFNGQAGATWRIATCTPGNNPLEKLESSTWHNEKYCMVMK